MPKIKVTANKGGSEDDIQSISFNLECLDDANLPQPAPNGLGASMLLGGCLLGSNSFNGKTQCPFSYNNNPPSNAIFRFALNGYQNAQFIAPFISKSLPKTAVFTQPAPVGSVYVPPAPTPNSDGIFITPMNYIGQECSLYYNPGLNPKGEFAGGAFGIKDWGWIVRPGLHDGLAGYTLLGFSDRVIAFDYLGTGQNDYLACCRPGMGVIWIMSTGDILRGLPILNIGDTAYTSPAAAGIQGIPLNDLQDRVFACGPNGESNMSNCLGFYDVEKGTVTILS